MVTELDATIGGGDLGSIAQDTITSCRFLGAGVGESQKMQMEIITKFPCRIIQNVRQTKTTTTIRKPLDPAT